MSAMSKQRRPMVSGFGSLWVSGKWCIGAVGVAVALVPGIVRGQDLEMLGSDTAKMVILLDRTGSMEFNKLAPPDGRTRCLASVEQAEADVNSFLLRNLPPTNATRSVSIWTFTATSGCAIPNQAPDPNCSLITNRTLGFVGLTDALSALTVLKGENCVGATPLAEAVCTVGDAPPFPSPGPSSDKILVISSDGGENRSRIGSPCVGSTAGFSGGGVYSLSPSPPYDTGSWQQLVTSQVESPPKPIFIARHWGSFDTCGLPNTNNCCTAHPLTPGCGDAACCAFVCSFNKFCCDLNEGWVQGCADLAQAFGCACAGPSSIASAESAILSTEFFGDPPGLAVASSAPASDITFFENLAVSSGGVYIAMDDANTDLPLPVGRCCLLDDCVHPIEEAPCESVGGTWVVASTSIPTVTEWGIVSLSLLLLVGLTIKFRGALPKRASV